MKKIRVFFMFLCLCAGLSGSLETFAQEEYVYDQADLLTEEEEWELQAYAEAMSNQWEMNFVLVTADNANGKSSMEYADDFYDVHFPEDSEEDGILYLIDMDNREIYMSTSGIAIRYMTDGRIDSVLDTAFECVVEEDYYGTFQVFLDETQSYLYEGIPGDQYNYDVETGEIDAYEEPMRITGGEFLFAFIVALIPALLTVGIIKAKYQLKFEDFHYDPTANSDITLSVKSDRLVNKIVTHRRIPKDSNSSGRSSGGGGSSVHHSSSGRSHGGGGRSF